MRKISAEDIKPGMLVLDNDGPEVFAVLDVHHCTVSVMVYGAALRSNGIMEPVTTLFVYGDGEIFHLND